MTDIVLSPITSGYNLSKINSNFTKIANAVNNDILHIHGGNNTMEQDLDMNSYALLNVKTDPNNPDSLLTVGEGDARYYNVDGDMLVGPMNVNGQTVTGLKAPVEPTEAVRKLEFDSEVSARTAADANIQDQLTGNVPLEASAFSPISWHDQSIDNSVTIPNNKNAWSFGPVMTVSMGQTITIGDNSFWTIADGELQ